jgi:ketosteroid isomerase-like protein
MITRALILVMAMVIGGVASAVAHPPNIVIDAAAEKGIGEEITAFRQRLAGAAVAKDVQALRQMYADTFQHTHTSAKTDNKDARLVALLAGDPLIETAPTTELSIRAHAGGWIAVAFGVSPIKALSDGKVYAVRWTAVYARTEQSWQLVASQATRGHEIKN